MQAKSDAELLREYAHQASEAALREIVSRHADLVYASALRQVGTPDLARDIAQGIFTDLARKAPALAETLIGNASLLGWLYRSTRFAALNQLRDDRRRLARERQAMEHFNPASDSTSEWEQVQPVLDEAMADLSDEDRDALLLRFFKSNDFRALGSAFGISDDAAQKRVSRALERLRTHLTARGVTTTAVTLTTALAANAVPLAPAGLAATLSTAALAGTAVPIVATTAIKTVAMTTLQKTIVSVTIAALAGTGIYEACQVSRLREENRNLAAKQEAFANERDTALSAIGGSKEELDRLQKNQLELARLRGEVAALRRQTNDFARLANENRQLQAALAKAAQAASETEPDPDDTPERRMAIAKMNNAKQLVLALRMYAEDNREALPTDFSHVAAYLGLTPEHLAATNQFELVIHGPLRGLTNVSALIAVREKEASVVGGKRVKAYGFVDGHSELKTEPPEGFDAWEKAHMLPRTGE